MPQQRGGLGKGLDALIPAGKTLTGASEQAAATGGVTQVAVSQIVPNPRQPRTRFDPVELDELSESIRTHGVIQPLIVSRNEGGDGYVLIAGERRWQASKQAGLAMVPVIVRQSTDLERLELALIENVQRADLNAIEEAVAFQHLADEFKLSHEDIAARVGKSRVTITNTLRLLKLPKVVQSALVDGQISEGHARALLALENPQAQMAAMHTIIRDGLNVRQTEDLVRKYAGEKPAIKPRQAPPPDIAELEQRLQNNLGTKVALKHGKKGNGTITLHYYSNEELNTLLDKLLE